MKCIYSSVYGQNLSGDVFRIIKSRMEPVLPEVKHPLLNIMLRSYYKTLYERDRTSDFAHIKYDRARDYYYLDVDSVFLELLTEAELKGLMPPDSAESRGSP